MAYHSFSLDPRTVLGVGSEASLDDIHEAYRSKSKKHHPDAGGDEWAFRMVTRAYEVLKTTAALTPAQTTVANATHGMQRDHARDWSTTGHSQFNKTDSPWVSTADAAKSTNGASGKYPDEEAAENASAAVPPEAQSPIVEPDEIRIVDVELIWTRFEKEGSRRLLSTQEGDDATLSVCLVISWPPHELVDRAAEFTSSGETLRTLIELFGSLRGQKSVVAARSRIEDGRFVGWLSFPDVLTAQDTFLVLRDSFHARGITVKLNTRDERVPFEWYGVSHRPVMAHAS